MRLLKLLSRKMQMWRKKKWGIDSSVNVSFCDSHVGVEKLIDCARLVWVMGFVLRFAHNLKTFLSRYELQKGICCLKNIKIVAYFLRNWINQLWNAHWITRQKKFFCVNRRDFLKKQSLNFVYDKKRVFVYCFTLYTFFQFWQKIEK